MEPIDLAGAAGPLLFTKLNIYSFIDHHCAHFCTFPSSLSLNAESLQRFSERWTSTRASSLMGDLQFHNQQYLQKKIIDMIYDTKGVSNLIIWMMMKWCFHFKVDCWQYFPLTRSLNTSSLYLSEWTMPWRRTSQLILHCLEQLQFQVTRNCCLTQRLIQNGFDFSGQQSFLAVAEIARLLQQTLVTREPLSVTKRCAKYITLV